MPILNNLDYEYIQFKNRLKTISRTGWKEIGIPDEEVESVYSHIAATKDLIADFNERENLGLDLAKINKMLTIASLPKAYTKEERSIISGENSKEKDRNIVLEIVEHFNLNEEVIALYDEYMARASKDADFAFMFSKYESDLQAAEYYRRGLMDLDRILKDIEFYDEKSRDKARAILAEHPVPPLGWLTYDSQYYEGNELLTNLSNDLIADCIKFYEDNKANTLK